MAVILRADPRSLAVVQELVDALERTSRPGSRQRRAVADAVRQGLHDNFLRQASGDGPGWAPLALSTILDRQRQGYPGTRPILVRSGSYRAHFIERDDPGHVEEFRQGSGGWSLEVGPDEGADPRVIFHEEGTVFMPARPASMLSRSSEERIGNVLDWVYDAILPHD
jgi:hypothetical protein